MKITIGESYVLIAGGRESPEDLRFNAQAQLQIQQRLRAVHGKALHRGNVMNTLSFQITREHESFAAAELYLLTHAAAIPTSGDITIDTEGGESAHQILWSDAVVHVVDSQQIGVSTIHRYTITGGELALVPPEPVPDPEPPDPEPEV